MNKLLSTLRDFSGGQPNNAAKRADEREEYKTGARVMSDWLIETTGTLIPRPGRRLMAQTGAPRVEFARLGSTNYGIAFGQNSITIYDLTSFLPVASNTNGAYLWTTATVGQVYMTVCDNQIVVCFPGMQPQLAIRAPTTGTWTFAAFAFRTITNQSQQPFYRAGNPGAIMGWDNVTGAINLTCSQPYFTPAMVGSILSLLGQQVTITGVSGPQNATANVAGRLPDFLSLAVSDGSPFEPGQIVEQSGGAYKIEVYSVTPHYAAPVAAGQAATNAIVNGVLTSSVINSHAFGYGDLLVSELGQANVTGETVLSVGFTEQWQEQFMGSVLGWPQACGFDKSRLIFFDFPQKPGAILWSAVGAYDVFWIDQAAATLQPDAGTLPNDAILNFIPEGPRVRHVIGWGDEFVFTDRGIFQIPISASGNPLQPGSVEFRQFSNDGVGAIVPIKTQDSIVYINAGGQRASAVIATGSYTRPYVTNGASEVHTDLFTSPVAMAIAPGDGDFPERLIYVLNADGSIAQGRFNEERKFIGWQPWTSQTLPSWLFCTGPDMFYCVPLGGSWWLAIEDSSLYLDDAIFPNALPASFPPTPAGDGPLTMLAGATVTMMDGLLDRGERAIDVNGNLVTLDTDDDVSSVTLVVGFSYAPKLQPFAPEGQPGASEGQRQHRRKITRAMVTYEGATGFTLGTREVSSYRFGDDPTQPPPLYDGVVATRPLGRSYDPGCLLVKSRPGPLRIVEYSTEATV